MIELYIILGVEIAMLIIAIFLIRYLTRREIK